MAANPLAVPERFELRTGAYETGGRKRAAPRGYCRLGSFGQVTISVAAPALPRIVTISGTSCACLRDGDWPQWYWPPPSTTSTGSTNAGSIYRHLDPARKADLGGSRRGG